MDVWACEGLLSSPRHSACGERLPRGCALLHWGRDQQSHCRGLRKIKRSKSSIRYRLTEVQVGRGRVECFRSPQEGHHNQMWAVWEGSL